MSVHPLGTNAASRLLRSRSARAIASGFIGLALAAAVAAPASAADTPPTSPPPALSDWGSVTSTGAAAPAATSSNGSHLAAPASLQGERQTFQRGGALAWETDTFEWYWSGSSMSSSTAWQADGYIFPNTVTLMGVKRTYASKAEHLWRGTAAIGAGVVTPWGTVNVYSQTTTDYFTLKPGKLTHSNS
jgi:opacity protein-like surface antigen